MRGLWQASRTREPVPCVRGVQVGLILLERMSEEQLDLAPVRQTRPHHCRKFYVRFVYTYRANCSALRTLANADKENGQPSDCPGSSWPPSMPMVERLVVLNSFLTLHMETLLLAVNGLKLSQESKTIDPDSEAVVFKFKYRTDNGGNPAKMFALVTSDVVPLQDVLRSADAQKLALREKSNEEMKKKGCRGMLHISFVADGIGRELQVGCPKRDRTDVPPLLVGMQGSFKWAIRVMIEEGLARTADSNWGHMVKTGKSWKWTEDKYGIKPNGPW